MSISSSGVSSGVISSRILLYLLYLISMLSTIFSRAPVICDGVNFSLFTMVGDDSKKSHYFIWACKCIIEFILFQVEYVNLPMLQWSMNTEYSLKLRLALHSTTA